MTTRREFLLRAAAASVMLGASVFVAVRTAVARDGRVGSARSFVTVAGTLTNLPAGTTTATVTFEFQRREGAAMTALCAQTVSATIGVGGAFSVPVPVATPESTCPDDIFDGRDVWVRALYGGAEVAAWAPVNPVPYAHFASVAGVAAVATQYGTPDCPVGYERDRSDATLLAGAGAILCRRGRDEVVRVGDSAAAFWIDRNEATIWSNPDGMGARAYDTATEESLDTFGLPRSGLWLSAAPAGTRPRPPLYAASVRLPGSHPSRWVTWFQANALCRASGKRLPTGDEWLLAAQGTPDDPTRCNTSSGAIYNLDNDQCFSIWGAEDMIGNLWEWTAEWYATTTTTTAGDPQSYWQTQGGASYGDDGLFNVASAVFPNNSGTRVVGLSSAAFRGGSAGNAIRSGIFAMNLNAAPSVWGDTIGFRCVIPR